MPKPNDGMKAEARRGLDWRKEYNRGGTQVGVSRARDIANGADLSMQTVRRMRSFFARHEVDKQAEGFSPGEDGYPSAGRIAWALWGGDPGQRWAEAWVRREESKSMKKTTMKVPRSALSVADHHSECFAEAEGENAKARFTMIANSGGVIPNHPHWGNFAIDFDGLKIAKQKLPALRDHSSQRIVGHTESIQVTDQGLVAEGVFANTPDGNEVSAMLADGYPWQASVYVPPKRIERLEEGESAEVNGFRIEGPGHIFRESHLREVTFTSLGADENTSAAVLSDHQVTIAVFTAQPEEVAMSEPTESVEASAELSHPAETDPKSAPELSYEEIVQEERDRISALLSAATKDQSELVSNLIQSGVSLSEGTSALLSDLKDRAEERLSHALNTTPEPVGPMTEEPSDPRSAFESDKELMAEFGSFEVYEAFTKAQDAGAIRGKV